MAEGRSYRFEGLWQETDWIQPAYVHLDEQGHWVSASDTPEPGKSYEAVKGFAIPGLQNAHSHAFQYAMVGLSEIHDTSGAKDDFWRWRKAMYQLALAMNPEQMEAVATALYKEMLRHGYTGVAEFHYVHHDESGTPYYELSELGGSLVNAAKNAGIRITLIPIFYQKGGFGKGANPDQRRFVSQDIEQYERLLESTAKVIGQYENANLGCGVHSLRAVEPALVQKYCEHYLKDLPFHIHVSEQLKEVEQSIEYLGSRPVEWLLDNVNLSQQFNLVHATHLNNNEVRRLAESKARVVLCPSTEGNLADGLFNLLEYQNHNGQWSIGTDSHIGLNPFEELRILDYGQRVTRNQRNIFVNKENGNAGVFAIQQFVRNGKIAMGKSGSSKFESGDPFDVLVLDAEVPMLAVCSKMNLLNTIVYASDVSMHLGTMISGDWIIHKGRHQNENVINQNFKKSLIDLSNR